MTGRLAACLGMAAGVLLCSLYTGERLYAVLLLLLLFLLFLGLLHIGYTLLAFRFSQSLTSAETVKGGSVRLQVSIHNEGILPFSHVSAAYALPDSALGEPPHVLSGSIAARGSMQADVQVRCPYRGVYEPGLLSLRVRDLFGLYSVTVPFRLFSYYRPLRLTVRPRIAQLPGGLRSALLREGQTDAANRGAQSLSSVRDIRDMRPGDQLKYAHMKLSARHRKYLVREFEGSARPQTLLLLDCQEHGREGRAKMEIEDLMIEAAAALSHHLLGQRAPVRLVAYDKRRFAAQGEEPRHFGPFYAFFALAKFDGEHSLAELLPLEAERAGMHIAVVTSHMDGALFGRLLALKEAGNDITAVVAALPRERERDVDRAVEELRRRDVRALAISPGEAIEELRGGF